MPELTSTQPLSPVEPVTEVLHGVTVTDPYRWLEEQNSVRTRAWIEEQRNYARACLDSFPGRDSIRQRIRAFLAIETYDSLQKSGSRYFFRKRFPDQEQPCIYMREGTSGEEHLLVDPAEHGPGKYTAVKPLRVSPDGRLLLFEVKEGGERTGTFKLLEIESRRILPDVLPRGYLRGFAFAPDGKGFYCVHEGLDSTRPYYRSVYHHILGTEFSQDEEIFHAGESKNLRLSLVSEGIRLGFLVYHLGAKTRTDFYLRTLHNGSSKQTFVTSVDYIFGPLLIPGKILAITDCQAPNLRIVELIPRPKGEPEWIDLVPETDSRIQHWVVAGDHLLVSYIRGTAQQIWVFDLEGNKVSQAPLRCGETVRIAGASSQNDEVFFESESFTQPITIERFSAREGKRTPWAKRTISFDSAAFDHIQVSYASKDGTEIPMYLVGRREVLAGGCHPAIMTSYGGFGVSMMPQFSVFVALLIERGCLFALPNIRGGSEFGTKWHQAAKRQKRQKAYDDFIAGAEWLIQAGRTTSAKLAIFGGSNSGLLVGAAMTQRPDLFRAVVCMVPMLDMLRYHLFDNAHVWSEEFGTADDPDDFQVLSRYSPYHQVRDGVLYPATMIVSGDADRNCNPLHARKMTARLQAANASPYPIVLDYSLFRGHSPVLPLSVRIDALTDRIAFLCSQLQLRM